jgi:hypothetical protein
LKEKNSDLTANKRDARFFGENPLKSKENGAVFAYPVGSRSVL